MCVREWENWMDHQTITDVPLEDPVRTRKTLEEWSLEEGSVKS